METAGSIRDNMPDDFILLFTMEGRFQSHQLTWDLPNSDEGCSFWRQEQRCNFSSSVIKNRVTVMRLLLIPAAGGVGLGPLTNLLAIADEATAAGHEVAFVVKDAWAYDIRQLGFPAYRAVTPRPYRGIPPPPYNLGAVVTRLGWVDESFIRDSVRAECQAITTFGADVVVTTLQFTAPISAALQGLPSAAIFSWADGPGFVSPLYKSTQYVTGGEICYNRVLEENGLEPIGNICELAFQRSELKVAPTIPELQPELLALADVHFVGHLLSKRLEINDMPDQIKSWSGSGPLIYVYLGPGDISAEQWMPAIAEAFEHTNFRVMVSLAQLRTAPSSVPVLRNVRFFERLPGMTAITYSDLVISHGGANTVNNALLAGKPHIVFPDGYAERDYNGRSIAKLGAGLNCSTDQLNPKDLRLMAEKVIANGIFAQNAAQLGRRIQEYGGAQHVIELIEGMAARS
jgi:UDP:flavonoid glycosyltransferase YjiC (YdhE family)